MAEAKMYAFAHREVAEALVKQQGIHEGIWGIYIEFGIGAANVAQQASGDVLPSAIVPVVKMGIQRFDEPNNLTVDAAVVNPMKAVVKGKVLAKKRG